MTDSLDVAAVQESFSFAADTVKQLLTLSTAILGFTITFRTQMPRTRARDGLLAASWFVYFLSIFCGVWSLFAFTGSSYLIADVSISDASLEDRIDALPSINDPNVTIPSRLQLVTFVVGTFFIVFFGVLSLWKGRSSSTSHNLGSRSGNVTGPAPLQFATFLLGVLLILASGLLSTRKGPSSHGGPE